MGWSGWYVTAAGPRPSPLVAVAVAAPLIRARTREVLRSLGVGDDELETLAAGKAIQ